MLTPVYYSKAGDSKASDVLFYVTRCVVCGRMRRVPADLGPESRCIDCVLWAVSVYIAALAHSGVRQ